MLPAMMLHFKDEDNLAYGAVAFVRSGFYIQSMSQPQSNEPAQDFKHVLINRLGIQRQLSDVVPGQWGGCTAVRTSCLCVKPAS